MAKYQWLLISWGKRLVSNWHSLYVLTHRLYAFARALDRTMRFKIFLLQLLRLGGYVIYLLGSLAIVPFINYAVSQEASLKSWWMKGLHDLITENTAFNFVLCLAALSILVLVLSRLAQVLADYTSMRLSMALRLYYESNLFHYYIRQNVLLAGEQNVSGILHNVTRRLPGVLSQFINPFLDLIHTLMYITVGLVILFLTDPILIVAAVTPVVLFLVVSFYATRYRLTKWSQIMDKENLKRHSKMLESLLAREYIQILGKENIFSKVFRDTLKRTQEVNLKIRLIQLIFRPIGEILIFSTLIAIVSYVLLVFSDADLTRVTVFMVILYRIAPQGNSLFSIYASLKQGTVLFDASAKDLLPALRQKVSYEPHIPNPLPFKKHLRFESVSCRYPGVKESPQVLKNINLTINQGMKVGICGESGSGKTTLLRMLIGMLRPQEGRIFIDDKGLTPSLTRAWQDNLGYVSQNLILLKLSVLENIALVSEGEQIDETRVSRVLAATESLKFVNELPQGIHTTLDVTDTKLSGGQKQRLVIARSLYSQPNLLVLDEATSALDKKTERKIMANIHQTMKDKTVIIVTHRIDAIKNCDMIVVMKDGIIEAQGSYAKLKKNKEFALLAK